MNYRVVVKRLAKSDLDVALEYYAIIRENLKDSLLEEVSKVFLLLEKTRCVALPTQKVLDSLQSIDSHMSSATWLKTIKYS